MSTNASNLQAKVGVCVERAKPLFDAVQSKINDGIALFGAGQFGIAALEYLRNNGYKVLCFIDNSPQKQGTCIDGVPVVSKDNPATAEAGVVLITAKHAVEAINASLSMPAPRMSFDAWFLMVSLSGYRGLRDGVLQDERSRECLDGVMLTMLTGDETYCAAVMDHNQYFCLPQFVNVGTDSFVDAGAYVGDTVEKFIWANNGAFKNIYAFEPCRQQLSALKKRRDRLIAEWAINEDNFQIVNAGLGRCESTASINVAAEHLLGATLDIHNSGTVGEQIKVYSLDGYLKGKPVTFIKADIEGMEIDMLLGASNTIKANKPKMALSVYHKPDDLLKIVEFVLGVDGSYKLALRQHSPLLMDTTLYCWR